ncbi:formate dehydrogenase accessory sulfurtransferase FdhD [Rathayibacter rathayi]|uniref:formate dehydrogenase accessory sulfurtransferase FdhD n=1 Tax=Rathayibacter rathayi TaxID=33887 RepID=UPI000CE7A503|nr:formate dehydrogenase accessory sulfurtransferase FdhD [Rathayibacter rathayi]PPG66119.1 sulfurtransferase FdhD [Rathayibacter rathayi]PPG74928.1 sulfurtransferase FdhD [Rathayibacter rathayi]PPI76396.1 sulfurtransferase FdhD [Rathayibacter rathayi]
MSPPPPLPRFDAIVLAGGRATRLGGALKPLLPHRDSTLLGLALEAVHDAERRVVAGPPTLAPALDGGRACLGGTAVRGSGRERERSVYTTSSCGVCGLASLDVVATDSAWSVAEDELRVERELVVSLPDRLREAQAVFERTGGVQAAGLFDSDGSLLVLREDLGRHNAVDKVVGWGLREGRLPLRGTLLQVSGRASFELMQKAVMAGIPLLSAVGTPPSLAVNLARDSGLTLIGFSRGSGFNLYSGDARLPP